jgi:hypothetical protein
VRSSALKARFQCVRVRAQCRVRAQARVHSRACRGLLAPGPCVCYRVGTRRRAGRNTRQRSGKTPQTARKPGLGAGPGHPEPRRERRDISRPFGNDHAG